jgi:pimeloyl-ACP methyl ester carboxylesterase
VTWYLEKGAGAAATRGAGAPVVRGTGAQGVCYVLLDSAWVRDVAAEQGLLTDPDLWEQAEREMRPPDIDGTPVERFVQFMRNWPHLKDIFSDQLRDMILYNFDVRDDKIYRRLSIRNHMKIARAIFNQRPSELLPRIECPVLIIPAIRETTSEDERRWQEYRKRGIAAIKKARPNVEVQPMMDTIHDVPVQRPRELASAIAGFAEKLDGE